MIVTGSTFDILDNHLLVDCTKNRNILNIFSVLNILLFFL